MVRIRLKRTGQRNRPHYRIIVIDGTRSRDGKYIEALGHYNPRDKALVLDKERADYWLSKGAQPSDTAGRLLRRYTKMTANPPPSAPVEPPPLTEAPVSAEAEPLPETLPAPENPDTTAAAPTGGNDETTD